MQGDRVRLAAAIGLIAVTLATALYVHQRWTVDVVCTVPGAGADCGEYAASSNPILRALSGSIVYSNRRHPSWEDPVAVLLALGGLAGAAGILTTKRTRKQHPTPPDPLAGQGV